MIYELFNSVIEMRPEERLDFVRKLPGDQLDGLKELMGLPIKTSIKKLCKEIEETAIFIRIAKGK